MNKNGLDNFDLVESSYSNFDTDFSNAVDPQTAQVLAQTGTQIVAGAIQNKRAKEQEKDALDKLIDKSCGKAPKIKRLLGKNTKAYNDYLACSQKVTKEQGDLQQQIAQAETQRLMNEAQQSDNQQSDSSMSTGTKIAIGVGVLALLGGIIYFVKKG